MPFHLTNRTLKIPGYGTPMPSLRLRMRRIQKSDSADGASGGLSGGGIAAEAEGVAVGAHGFEAEFDVIFERDAEFFGAFADVVARDAAGECFVLHALFHGIDFQIQNAF